MREGQTKGARLRQDLNGDEREAGGDGVRFHPIRGRAGWLCSPATYMILLAWDAGFQCSEVNIPRQSRGLYDVSRSKRLFGVANAAPCCGPPCGGSFLP